MGSPLSAESDSQYLASVLGDALKQALAEVCERKPWDPIEYLALWLKNYSANAEYARKEALGLAQIEAAKEEARREKSQQSLLKVESRHIRHEEDRRKMMFLDRSIEIEDIEKAAELEALESAASGELALPELSRDGISSADDLDLDTFRSDDLPLSNEPSPANIDTNNEINVDKPVDNEGLIASKDKNTKEGEGNDEERTQEDNASREENRLLSEAVGEPEPLVPPAADVAPEQTDGSVDETDHKTRPRQLANPIVDEGKGLIGENEENASDNTSLSDDTEKAVPAGSLNTIQEED